MTTGLSDYQWLIDQLDAFCSSSQLSRIGQTRVATYLKNLRRLRSAMNEGRLHEIDDRETLWSLVEGFELATAYSSCEGLASPQLQERYRHIIKGHSDISNETETSNRPRNLAFELNLASYLVERGIDVQFKENPDLHCRVDEIEVLIQCKRPFRASTLLNNLKEAGDQLTRDLNFVKDNHARGIAALSCSRILNDGNELFRARTQAELSQLISSSIIKIVGDAAHRFTADKRIVGCVFHVITPVVTEDTGFSYGIGQELVAYPALNSTSKDQELLWKMFMPDYASIRPVYAASKAGDRV